MRARAPAYAGRHVFGGVRVDMRYVTRYAWLVIRSIRHKGLRRLYESDEPRGVIAEHAEKLRDILARLDAARDIGDMDVAGFRLATLKREFKGVWGVIVPGNLRGNFPFV